MTDKSRAWGEGYFAACYHRLHDCPEDLEQYYDVWLAGYEAGTRAVETIQQEFGKFARA